MGCVPANSYFLIYLRYFPLDTLDCWKEVAVERPTFEQLILQLEQMMTTDTPYFDFEKLDDTEAYYNEAFSDSNESNGSLDTKL